MSLLLVVGYGPGNSRSIAHRFGREGWKVALVGRNADRLAAGVTELGDAGTEAHAFIGDASDPASIRDTVREVQARHGPVSAVVFSAYRSVIVGDVLSDDPDTVGRVFDIGVSGLVSTVQTTLDDLTSQRGAVLVLNGALGLQDDRKDAYAVSFGADGVALECAAKTKLVGLLAARLRGQGVYAGEIVIDGSVKGAPGAGPDAIDPDDVAEQVWAMNSSRTEVHTRIGGAQG